MILMFLQNKQDAYLLKRLVTHHLNQKWAAVVLFPCKIKKYTETKYMK